MHKQKNQFLRFYKIIGCFVKTNCKIVIHQLIVFSDRSFPCCFKERSPLTQR
ncbi:MAG: hypothetical protein KA717_36560 [Woronichinia naegeliana WA131]|uniref:Uncharacterized protein n=1 Tax=Woronichinia naegeliana WA131 TaxID=2824559 RepID=A0A977PVC4_9CYAN|nr:MAG: hypothetical protein KA717_36560 [Woronichinia naegeliana WA131]